MNSPSLGNPTVVPKKKRRVQQYLSTVGHVTLENALRLYFDTMAHADFVIECADGKVPLHKAVLAAVSPFLKSILDEIPDACMIVVPDIKVKTMTSVLSIFYTGQVCSHLKEDFEEIKQGAHLLGLNVDAVDWKVEIVENIVDGVDVPIECITSNFSALQPQHVSESDPVSSQLAPVSEAGIISKPVINPNPLPNVTSETDRPNSPKDLTLDGVAEIEKTDKDEDTSKSRHETPNIPLPAVTKTFGRKRKIPRNDRPVTIPNLQEIQQNLVSILPNHYIPPMPVQIPIQQMFVSPSTSDVIQAMLQSQQLSLGPNFSTEVLPQQLYQSPTTYVPGINSSTAPTFVNNSGIPIQFGYYNGQGQGQTIPKKIQPKLQPTTGITAATSTTASTLFSNQAANIRIQGDPTQGKPVTARMIKNGANPRKLVQLKGDSTSENTNQVVYVLSENFYGSTDESNSGHSEQSGDVEENDGEADFEGELIEIIGYNVEDQENEFQLSEVEIMENQQVATKKDHAYAFYAVRDGRNEKTNKLVIDNEEIKQKII